MQHTTRRPSYLRLWIAVLTGVLSMSASAEDAWDEAKARAYAAELASSLEALLADAGTQHTQSSAVQQRKHEAALIDLRQMGRMADDLAQKLEAGQGRDQTAPLVRQISLQRETVRFYARDSTVPAGTRARVARAVSALNALEALYVTD